MVFVLSKNKKHKNMCTNGKARFLLSRGYAVVHKIYPFTIRLKKNSSKVQEEKEYKLKIDPGSKYTGLALVDNKDNAVFLAEIEHRGQVVVSNLKTRHDARRNRRQRETRYRRCKFINHYLKKESKYKATTDRPKGWLPPSIISIEQNIINWIKILKKLCKITKISIEAVKFDSQLMDNPNIEGIEYQQGTLMGYEIREYLYYKYGHNCQYCNNESKDNRLEIEHITSRTNGGSNSIKNLSLACRSCNESKGFLNLKQWLEKLKGTKKKSKLTKERIKRVGAILINGTIHKAQRYSAWVNSYKEKLIRDVRALVPQMELSTGGRTRYNRNNLNLPKEHYYDALCIREVPDSFKFKTKEVLIIKACGRGSRFRGRTNSCGIIIKQLPRQKMFFGFQTGDIIKAVVSKGKKKGKYLGRAAVRNSGYFNVQLKEKVVQGINYKDCKIVQRNDGYSYFFKTRTEITA